MTKPANLQLMAFRGKNILDDNLWMGDFKNCLGCELFFFFKLPTYSDLKIIFTWP